MITYFAKDCARLSMLSLSRFVVGSSSAKTPQFTQNVSARARRMMREARTLDKVRKVTALNCHLLPGTAATTHVKLGFTFHHDHLGKGLEEDTRQFGSQEWVKSKQTGRLAR